MDKEIITDTATALKVFADEKVMGLDLETSGLSFITDEIAVVSLYGEKSKETAILHVQGTLSAALIEFLSTERLFITHNGAAFDLLFLSRAGIDVDIPVWYDSLLAESITIASARKDLRVSLQASVKRRLGILLAKDQGLSTWMAKSLTPEQIRYCREDVMYLPRLRKAQIKAMGTEQIRALQFEHELLPTLVKVALRGLPFDHSRFADYEQSIKDQQDWALQHFTATLGSTNIHSPSQVIKSVKEAVGYTLANANTESLATMSEEPGAAGTLGKALILTKQMMTKGTAPIGSFWIDRYVVDGYIYPRYRQVDRDCGRVGLSEPDLETAPPTARRLIGGVEGHTIVSATLQNLWWGTVAFLAKDPAMQSLVQKTVPEEVAKCVFQNTPFIVEDSLERTRIGGALIRSCLFGHPIEKFQQQLRSMGVDSTLERAEDLRRAFLMAYPSLSKWHAQAANQSMLPAVPITFPTGMRRTLANAKKHEILSLRAKGTVGSLIKYCITTLAEAGLDQHLIGVVGEEFIFILQNSQVEKTKQEIHTCLQQSTKSTLNFPLPILLKSASHWLA